MSTVSRASSTTTLKFGLVEAEVGLYKTTGDPKGVAKFETASPEGGILRTEKRAVETAPADTPQGVSPLAVAVEPKTDEDRAEPIPSDVAERQTKAYEELTTAPGEYRNVLIEEGTGEVVEPEEVRKGLRDADGNFTDLTDYLASIEQRTQLEQMEVVKFIDVGQVPRDRVMASYYIGSADVGAPRVLRLLSEAMQRKRRVALVKWTKSTRQAFGVVVRDGRRNVLTLLQLAWAENVREPNAKCNALQQAEVSEQEVDAACSLIEAMQDTWEAADELRDNAIVMREELIEAVEDGTLKTFKLPPAKPEAGEDVDLADAMARSVEAVA